MGTIGPMVVRMLLNDSDVNHHVVAEVLVSRDQGIALLILEADSLGACWAGVEAIEILDGCDDGVGGIMGIDLDSHRQARAIPRRVCE